MQTPSPLLPPSHLPGCVKLGSQLHSEGTCLVIKAFATGGSYSCEPDPQSTLPAPPHVLIHANIVKSYVFE